MTPSKTTPKVKTNSPLLTGNRWLWIPVLSGTAINIVFQVAFYFLVQR